MSRPPPHPIDYDACKDVAAAARDVRDHLLGWRLGRRLGFDIEKVLSKNGWAVGSHVWRPALGVQVDPTADFDFVCIDQARLDLVTKAIEHLYDKTTNSFGSTRYLFKGTSEVAMDVWRLPDGVSIAEHIASFPDRHQGVAYAIGVPVDLALVRTTHEQVKNVRPGAPTIVGAAPAPLSSNPFLNRPIVFPVIKKARDPFYPGDP